MKPTATYSSRHAFSGLVMMIALLWLTVSLPFVYSAQQEVKKTMQSLNTAENNPDDNSNPLSNTNEERPESGANTLSEYLHDYVVSEHHFITRTSFFKCHPSDLYFAFHPELVSPPPDRS